MEKVATGKAKNPSTMKGIEKFFAFFVGANIGVLEKCPSTERYKFIAVGIGVLNTALLSMFTMWFAMHSVAPNTNVLFILPFSIFWGLIIFGIDWGLIITMHRPKKFDWKSGTGFAFTTLFRIVVAVLISLTVSKPLEVVLFKDYLPVAQLEMRKKYKNDLDAPYEEKEKHTQARLDSVNNQLNNLPAEIQQARTNDSRVQSLTSNITILEEE
jgi:hypothetical protein